jgi:hypothetical protein
MNSLYRTTDTWALPDTPEAEKSHAVWLRPYALIASVYVSLTFLTRPLFQGDTLDYASSVVGHTNGGYYQFWEFGHLLWRPLGLLVFRVTGSFLARFVGPAPYLQITLGLIIVSWLAGLAGALLLLALLRTYTSNPWIPPFIVISFMFSLAELNYSRTGSSYIPGLSFLILAIYLSARQARNPSPNTSIAISAIVGLALAASVSLWFLYAFAVPAAILLPLIFEGFDKARLRTAIWIFIFFSFSISTAYAAVLIHLRISTVSGLMTWVLESSHGMTIQGVSRMIFGWPRSIIDMSVAGKVIKRYLLRDPFNPVSSLDLFKLWPDFLKLALFYLTVLSTVVTLRQFSRGRKALAVAGIAALPVLGFAVYWSGGDPERYLPLYPFFFLALCLSLSSVTPLNWVSAVICTFMIYMVLTNAISLRPAAARRIQTRAEDRVNPLLPELKPGSRVIVSHDLDDLVALRFNFPFNSVNQQNLSLYSLVTPGRNDVAVWRVRLASNTLSTWQKDGDVWVSSRLLHGTPQADWNWVEGDDPRVSWRDFSRFFSQLQFGESVGGDDGFLQISRSNKNESFLHSITSN